MVCNVYMTIPYVLYIVLFLQSGNIKKKCQHLSETDFLCPAFHFLHSKSYHLLVRIRERGFPVVERRYCLTEGVSFCLSVFLTPFLLCSPSFRCNPCIIDVLVEDGPRYFVDLESCRNSVLNFRTLHQNVLHLCWYLQFNLHYLCIC